MKRFAIALVVAGLGGGVAVAQDRGKIPVERDLQRLNEVERRIDEREGTGSIPYDPNVSPINPSGVVGFSGAPGIVGDSVNSYSPLPPGAPGNETW